MADAVTTQVLDNDGKFYIAMFTNVSDGTGEAAVQKVDISGLTGVSGRPVTAVKIMRVRYSIQGFSSVIISFDHTADDVALALSGDGEMDLRDVGGLADPQSAGGTGDILFTAPSGATTGTYSIMLHLKK